MIQASALNLQPRKARQSIRNSRAIPLLPKQLEIKLRRCCCIGAELCQDSPLASVQGGKERKVRREIQRLTLSGCSLSRASMVRATRNAARNGLKVDDVEGIAGPPEPQKKGRRKKVVRIQSTASPASYMGAILEGLEDSGPKKTRRVLQMDLDQGPINNLLPDEVSLSWATSARQLCIIGLLLAG